MNYYKIEIEKKAKKKLLKMDKKNQFLILDYLKNTLSKLENPRSQGKALQGKYKGKWRYRVGNYRILGIEKRFINKFKKRRKIGRKIIETLEKDEYFLRAKRIEVPASITAVPFYKKWDIVAKME